MNTPTRSPAEIVAEIKQRYATREGSSALAPSKVASPSGAFSVTGGSARSGYEIIQSLRREGWTEDCMTMVFKSRDGRLVKIVWPDGKTAEARIEPNAVDVGRAGNGATPAAKPKSNH